MLSPIYKAAPRGCGAHVRPSPALYLSPGRLTSWAPLSRGKARRAVRRTGLSAGRPATIGRERKEPRSNAIWQRAPRAPSMRSAGGIFPGGEPRCFFPPRREIYADKRGVAAVGNCRNFTIAARRDNFMSGTRANKRFRAAERLLLCEG